MATSSPKAPTPEQARLFHQSQGYPDCFDGCCLHEALGRAAQAEGLAEWVLAMAMYRMELNDVSSGSDEWPEGLETNLGELDWQVEKMIRAEWAKLSRAERRELLKSVGTTALLNLQTEHERAKMAKEGIGLGS